VKLVLTGQSISDYRLALNHTPDSGGNTTTLATNLGVLSQPVSQADWVGQGDTHDYYLFETDGNGHVSLALEELTGDASLFLYNSSGNTLLASSTLSGLSDEAIDIQLTPATYLAKVSRVGTSAVQYSLSMSSEEETAGTTTESALMVGSLTDVAFTLTGWVGNRNTYDYYRLIVDNLGQMDLTLDGLSGDANLALFNGAGNSQLALSQNSGTTAESIDQQVAAGTYLVRVARGSNSTASYSLGLLAWGETEGNLGTLSDSPSLANGWVGAGDTLDAFPFVIDTAGVVSLGLTGLDGNADVLLTNASGSSLLASSALTGSLDEEIHILLASGSYQARVVRGSNASSRYDLSLSLANDEENLPLGTLSADPVSVTGWLGTGDSYDNYYFVVSQWGDVTLTLSNLRQNANLQLYSSSNSLLSSSTLAGTANDVIQYGVSAGTYLAQVVRATSGYTDYNLLLSYSEDTGGSMLTTPVSLGTLSTTPACVSGWVGGGDSVDYYRFVTDALGHVSLTLGNLTGDANLYLYDLVSGSVLASSTLSQTSNETILRQLASGTYVAAVTRGSGSGSRYALSATLTEENGSDTLADAPQVATLSASTTTITGWVGEGDSNDFFRFVMDTTGAATLKLSGLAADANLYLHQDNGSLLISSTLTGSNNEIIASQLTPATYVVRVGRSGTANTSYTLTMSSEAENADNDLGNLTEDNIRVGYVSPEDGQDIYLFVMATTSHTTLLLSGLVDDADLMLFSLDTVLLDSTTAQTTPDRTLQRQLAPGSYYVAVVNSNTEGSTDYQLAIQLASDQGGDSLADALNLGTPNGTLNSQGWLGVGDSVDYYRFAITRNTMVTLGLSGQLDVAGLYLMDGQGGATLATTTANGQSSPTIDLQLSAGSYAIRINSVTTSSNYQLDLSLTADAGEATSTARALGSLAYAPS
ncbi:MAG: hypothetical protein G8345_21730, partial [Magnetococcales bacterium]|nr:hypothetical protein [Magnetococcales bacterium]